MARIMRSYCNNAYCFEIIVNTVYSLRKTVCVCVCGYLQLQLLRSGARLREFPVVRIVVHGCAERISPIVFRRHTVRPIFGRHRNGSGVLRSLDDFVRREKKKKRVRGVERSPDRNNRVRTAAAAYGFVATSSPPLPRRLYPDGYDFRRRPFRLKRSVIDLRSKRSLVVRVR